MIGTEHCLSCGRDVPHARWDGIYTCCTDCADFAGEVADCPWALEEIQEEFACWLRDGCPDLRRWQAERHGEASS